MTNTKKSIFILTTLWSFTFSFPITTTTTTTSTNSNNNVNHQQTVEKVVIIGGGWGGLSTAYSLYKHNVMNNNSSKKNKKISITVIDSSPRVGGLVRDGFTSMNGTHKAEAGQHGFWDNYHNIFNLLDELPNIQINDVLTGYDEQGQYSPQGLEATWPVYRTMNPKLPTGLAQALYTRFHNLSVMDRVSAFPLLLAFLEFDDSYQSWGKYDSISFRELCVKLGVSKKCYDEAFEPMILTGLFAPGNECSAAAALGMAYFFVLKSQTSFDVRWCKGNIGDLIFQPWVDIMKQQGHDDDDEGNSVNFMTSTKVIGFEAKNNDNELSNIICQSLCDERISTTIEADKVVFAVGASALSSFVRFSPVLAKHAEFRKFANLRGTSVLATRIYLDKRINVPFSANACWGFDKGIGMTFFDITKLHNISEKESKGSIIEVDYYHATSLICMSDEDIVTKVKNDLNTILKSQAINASVIDAAIIRLPSAVNWYFPGSYAHMPDAQSESMQNVYFAGDLVRSRHGSWSQEKAFVSGMEVANLILGRDAGEGIIPLTPDEIHVKAGRSAFIASKTIVGLGDPSRVPSIVDFIR